MYNICKVAPNYGEEKVGRGQQTAANRSLAASWREVAAAPSCAWTGRTLELGTAYFSTCQCFIFLNYFFIFPPLAPLLFAGVCVSSPILCAVLGVGS